MQLHWDIFCRVIDNHGDIGVCWRLATGLTGRGERVRLWVDDASALQWMAPAGAPGVELRAWTPKLALAGVPVGDVLVEAFGCDIDPDFVAAFAAKATASGQPGLWLNLEYLSAEAYVERCHGLPSPVMSGAGTALRKYFFYPGFTEATGGLLREPDLALRQTAFDRRVWLNRMTNDFRGERLVSLFCYDPPALEELLTQFSRGPAATRLLVTAGRATSAVQACIGSKNAAGPAWNKEGKLLVSYLPLLSQHEFDHLLWSCDLNFVRGEDSLVRALWADRPFVWQPYPQADDAHQGKLEAFLDMLAAPSSLRSFHRAWNSVDLTPLPAIALAEWQKTATMARSRLLAQDDLVTRLLHFVQKNR